MHHQCETVVRCAAGTSEPFALKVGLHQGSAFSPFLFAIMMDSLTENIRKYPSWQMMFADDMVLCAREKDVLELELEQWREALEKRGMKVFTAKTEYISSNEWNTITKCEDATHPAATEFKYLGSILQSDGDMSTQVNKRTLCGWNKWRKMSGVLCDKRIPPRVNLFPLIPACTARPGLPLSPPEIAFLESPYYRPQTASTSIADRHHPKTFIQSPTHKTMTLQAGYDNDHK